MNGRKGGKGRGRTDDWWAGRATGFGADAVLMRCGGGSEEEAASVSSNGLFALAGVGVGVGVAMSGVTGGSCAACENGQWVQLGLRGQGSDWNSPRVENMVHSYLRLQCDNSTPPW